MKHLKKFFEDYEDYEEDAPVDNKDMVHIIQDIKDMGFDVKMFIKYAKGEDVALNRVNFETSLSPVKFEKSHKCYQIDIFRSLSATGEEPMVDVLSDFFYELQTVFSRLSEAGKVITNLAINTAKWNPTSTRCAINIIVITNEVIEEGEGSDRKLITSLVKAGFKPVQSPYHKELIEIQDLFPRINVPNGFYGGANAQERERIRNAWNTTRAEREREIKSIWSTIKKIARKDNVNVRWRTYLSGYSGLAFRLDRGKVNKIDTNLTD